MLEDILFQEAALVENSTNKTTPTNLLPLFSDANM